MRKPKVQYFPASSQAAPHLQFQEFQDDERVERKRGSESQRLAERYREDRSSVLCSLRSVGRLLREALG